MTRVFVSFLLSTHYKPAKKVTEIKIVRCCSLFSIVEKILVSLRSFGVFVTPPSIFDFLNSLIFSASLFPKIEMTTHFTFLTPIFCDKNSLGQFWSTEPESV
ncbi:MAG: hypothetical protein A2Y02_02090 [Omnitrophica bacterium GWA2_52_12]|nr:MAG: hypothetical protein A2Y02_02090 [Omnitrophica bacterium GWA2_52_12]